MDSAIDSIKYNIKYNILDRLRQLNSPSIFLQFFLRFKLL